MITIGSGPLTPHDVYAIAHGARVSLDDDALARCDEMADAVTRIQTGGEPVYGLTTGVGDLYKEAVRERDASLVQMQMLRAHATGVGTPHADEVVRAIMACLLAALIRGHSAVRAVTLRRLADMLNAGVVPVAPSLGSVGYLTATAHIGLALFGEGRAVVHGRALDGAAALREAGIEVDAAATREGHAMISGTYEVTALACLALVDGERTIAMADVVAALSLEGLRGNPNGYELPVQAMRPHPGQIATASRMRALLAGSEVVARFGSTRLQDALSVRCVPQVHGSARDIWGPLAGATGIEVGSVTDNPFFVLDGDAVVAHPNGNGHGAPVAVALDAAAIGLAEIANMSQARIERLTTATLSGLPAFLSMAGDGESGLMVVPVTAGAMLGEVRALAAPATVHSLPSVASQEDHVSQGVNAGMKLVRMLELTRSILAIEFLCAAQAVDFLMPIGLGAGTAPAYRALRFRQEGYRSLTVLADDIAVARDVLFSDEVWASTAVTS
jgi:histidine ammonia-lyase